MSDPTDSMTDKQLWERWMSLPVTQTNQELLDGIRESFEQGRVAEREEIVETISDLMHNSSTKGQVEILDRLVVRIIKRGVIKDAN